MFAPRGGRAKRQLSAERSAEPSREAEEVSVVPHASLARLLQGRLQVSGGSDLSEEEYFYVYLESLVSDIARSLAKSHQE